MESVRDLRELRVTVYTLNLGAGFSVSLNRARDRSWYMNFFDPFEDDRGGGFFDYFDESLSVEAAQDAAIGTIVPRLAERLERIKEETKLVERALEQAKPLKRK